METFLGMLYIGNRRPQNRKSLILYNWDKPCKFENPAAPLHVTARQTVMTVRTTVVLPVWLAEYNPLSGYIPRLAVPDRLSTHPPITRVILPHQKKRRCSWTGSDRCIGFTVGSAHGGDTNRARTPNSRSPNRSPVRSPSYSLVY